MQLHDGADTRTDLLLGAEHDFANRIAARRLNMDGFEAGKVIVRDASLPTPMAGFFRHLDKKDPGWQRAGRIEGDYLRVEGIRVGWNDPNVWVDSQPGNTERILLEPMRVENGPVRRVKEKDRFPHTLN